LKLITHTAFTEHDTGDHPENAKRIGSFTNQPDTDIPYDESVLSLVHSKKHIERIKYASAHSLPLMLTR
jgi:hypothetical protein